jgi:hypothetical protein
MMTKGNGPSKSCAYISEILLTTDNISKSYFIFLILLHIMFVVMSFYVYRLEIILTMVYVVQNSQNFSGLFPSSCI